MTETEKTLAYGKALMLYRRGMINHTEMMAQATEIEQEFLGISSSQRYNETIAHLQQVTKRG